MWAQTLQGRLTRVNKLKKNEPQTTVPSPMLLDPRIRTYVPTGSLVVIGTSHPGEEILVNGPSELKKMNKNLEITKGQVFWRRLPSLSESDIAYEGASEINLGPFSTVSATQPGDTYIQIESSKKKTKLDIFAIGSGVEFTCGSQKISIPESKRLGISFEANETSCKILSRAINTERQDLFEFYRSVMPAWFGKAPSDIAKNSKTWPSRDP